MSEAIPATLAEAVERVLADSRIHLVGGPGQLTWPRPVATAVEADGRLFPVEAVFLPQPSVGAALRVMHHAGREVPLLAVGPRINAKSADVMRSRGIWFVDGVGNAYMRGPGLIVDIRGRRGAVSSEVIRQHSAGAANPFTPKRAQVVLALLSAPHLVDTPFRVLAQHAGVSLGMVKDTIDALESVGFVEKLGAHRRLIRLGALLDVWVSTYPAGLGRTNKVFVARGDAGDWSPPGGAAIAISGEQAVSARIRNPESLVLYVDRARHGDVLGDLVRKNRWRRDPDGNIVVRDLFWHELPALSGLETAPAALVYADLLASGEPRQMEIARDMRRNSGHLDGL